MRPTRRVARHRQVDGSSRSKRSYLLALAIFLIVGVSVATALVLPRILDVGDGSAIAAPGHLPDLEESMVDGGSSSATASPSPSPSASPSASPTASVGVRPPPFGGAKLVFGIGAEANDAVNTRLAKEGPARMLTSWYNKPSDLGWMAGWRNNVVPNSYRAGFAMHLIVFTDKPEGELSTKYGAACGRPYPMSSTFLSDMQQLASIFAGKASGPPLYVTMFTEFQTYACVDNSYSPNAATTAYYKALKDQYLAARKIFKDTAPNARVSLGWGGWQARYDDPGKGGGRSMFGHFADVMRQSDFQSFQAMQSDTNLSDIRQMVAQLAPYGPVLLAHYKPDNKSQATFEHDVRGLLNDQFVREISEAGLFGLSFMDDHNLLNSPDIYQFVIASVGRFGRSAT